MTVPALLPFARSSPWRRPIAATAAFADPDDPATVALHDVDRAGSPWLNYSGYSHPINQATSSDPTAAVTDSWHAPTTLPHGGTWPTHIPAGARIASGSDGHMHVLDPAGTTVYEHWRATKNSDTAYTVLRRHAVNLTGTGIGPMNGVRAYGGSAIAGLIRAWEIDPTHPAYTGRIDHPLALAIRPDQTLQGVVTLPDEGHGPYTSAGYGRAPNGYVWPATESENGTGTIPLGAYFAIPRTIDLATLNLPTPELLMLATAAQTYGVYIVDVSASTCFYLEDDGGTATAAYFNAVAGTGYWEHQLRVIVKALRRVTNNSAETPNGAGI